MLVNTQFYPQQYHFNISYADELAIITDNIQNINHKQINSTSLLNDKKQISISLNVPLRDAPTNLNSNSLPSKSIFNHKTLHITSKTSPSLPKTSITYTQVYTSPHHSNGIYKKTTIKNQTTEPTLTNSPASLTQKFKILNTVIKPRIAYAYYAVTFSKPDIRKLDQIIGKLTKEICNIPKSTANILTHLPHENFGVNITSFLLDYIRCIGQQLIQALNDPEQLGIIYQGLAKHIATKYWGSLHLPKLKQQACVRSPIARTLFLLDKANKIHVTTATRAFSINKTPLEIIWKTTLIIITSLTSLNPKPKNISTSYTCIASPHYHISKTNTLTPYSPNEFQSTYKHIPKTIIEVLQQATTLFPPNIDHKQHHTTTTTPQRKYITQPQPRLILGQTLQIIIK